MNGGGARDLPAATSLQERRLIARAKCGDRKAQAALLARYEPMVWRIARSVYMPGGDVDDLAQGARLAILDAARCWDPARRVPFRSFAYLCAVREAQMAVKSARSGKHKALNDAYPLDVPGTDGLSLADTIEATGRPDVDPVAKVLGRELLDAILARVRTLSELERRVMALSANGYGHRDIAAMLGVSRRSVNNARQRGCRKLLGRPGR